MRSRHFEFPNPFHPNKHSRIPSGIHPASRTEAETSHSCLSFNPHAFKPLLCVLSASLILAGCSASSSASQKKASADTAQENNTNFSSSSDNNQNENVSSTNSSQPSGETLSAKLIDGAGTDTWILESDGNLYSMEAQNMQVENGMYLTVFASKSSQDVWLIPLETISNVEIEDKERDNRYDIGWTILETLWEEDPTLQNNTDILCIDLSQAGFLSEAEKEYLTHTFMDTYAAGKTLLQENLEQLQKDGYLTEDGRIFEQGIYLSISSTGSDTSLSLEAEKWHSVLGAIYMDFTAEKASEQWSLTLNHSETA